MCVLSELCKYSLVVVAHPTFYLATQLTAVSLDIIIIIILMFHSTTEIEELKTQRTKDSCNTDSLPASYAYILYGCTCT